MDGNESRHIHEGKGAGREQVLRGFVGTRAASGASRGMSLRRFLWAVLLVAVLCRSAAAERVPERITFETSSGTLELVPMDARAIRVKCHARREKSGTFPDVRDVEELIYVDSLPASDAAKFKVGKHKQKTVLSLPQISAEYDPADETLTFRDGKGRVILREKPGGRRVEASAVQGEPTWLVEQRFESLPDEYLCGTGQFQDGYLNVRGLTRRLTQVNTQISVPFVLSNRGYGILWNNYGLTDFNPAEERVDLTRRGKEGPEVTVDVTSTTGNRKERRSRDVFTGVFTVLETGDYSFLLDVGQKMGRVHHVAIDGKVTVNSTGVWLPPTTSFIVQLEKGTHRVEVSGDKGDSPTLFWREAGDETVFRSPVSAGLDYTVFAGDADEVIAAYRRLTGPAPLMPLWAMGYIHSRERYHSQAELLENASEARGRDFPVDVMVQDWQYWGKHGWNAMRFDEDDYPDPAAMVRELHEMNMRLMISVWAKVDANSELGRRMRDKGYYIPGTEWVDFFNPEAAGFYWRSFSDSLLRPYGIDAWWQDATEPENDDLWGRRVNKGSTPGEVYRNAFPMFVNRTVYCGLRRDAPDKRAMILTRCGFPGMQRYGTAVWSGDVGYDWETFGRQITAGLGLMASGLPWWTYDAGGFFRPENQYEDEAYRECFLRWLQVSAFLPLMRVHGYMSQTEPWRYGKEVEDIAARYVRLRYSLLPYIYSGAAAVTFDGYTLARPLVMDFPSDRRALEEKHQFMFGRSLLVVPVVAPSAVRWRAYLPQNTSGWTDFWSGRSHEGGQTVEVYAGKDRIPLFVRRGSIIPMDFGKRYAAERTEDPLEIRIYPGADASFTWYEDDGDNYDYEKGRYSTVEMKWDEKRRVFDIGDRRGNFCTLVPRRRLRLVVVSPENGIGDGVSSRFKEVQYEGKRMKIRL